MGRAVKGWGPPSEHPPPAARFPSVSPRLGTAFSFSSHLADILLSIYYTLACEESKVNSIQPLLSGSTLLGPDLARNLSK